MTYESSETSQHSGKPVELFRYEGTYQNFYYTSNSVEVEFQAPGDPAPVTYLPIPMKRSQVNVGTQNDDNAEISIDMPVTVDLVAIYGFQISPPELFLTVYRQHNPGEFVRYWGGPVDNINVLRGTASIRVPSRLAQALSADFPNVYYQGPCNHSLGDARCGVDMTTHELATTISIIAGKAITVASVGTLGGKLVGGEALLPSGERRMIISQVGTVININYPFAGAEVADAIILSEGCDLAFDGDCGTKFANQERFGGFPFIPPKNVFATGLEPGKDVSDTSCLPGLNLGFEQGNLSGWSYSGAGISIRTSTPNSEPSQEGTYCVDAGNNPFSTMYRTLIPVGPQITTIDAGTMSVDGFTCYHSTYAPQVDAGRLFVQFFDADGVSISKVVTAYSHPNSWTLRTMPTTAVPVGTRSIRWGVESDRIEGAVNDNYWDNFTQLGFTS